MTLLQEIVNYAYMYMYLVNISLEKLSNLNPVVADDLSSKLFILQQQGNEKYNANMPPVDMAESRIEDFRLVPPG